MHMLYEDFDDAKRLKLFKHWFKSRSRNQDKWITIDLYMLKESLKNVAKVWP